MLAVPVKGRNDFISKLYVTQGFTFSITNSLIIDFGKGNFLEGHVKNWIE